MCEKKRGPVKKKKKKKEKKEKGEKKGKKSVPTFFLSYIIRYFLILNDQSSWLPMKLHSLKSELDYKQYGS